MAPTGAAFNTDWIWPPYSNVHVCNNYEWFSSYLKFNSHLDSHGSFQGANVRGVGDVKLRVKTHFGRSQGRHDHGWITLRDVLYVPTLSCNILGEPTSFLQDYSYSNYPDAPPDLVDSDGDRCAIMVNSNPAKLWLCGQPQGQTSVDRGFSITAIWGRSERACFHRMELQRNNPPYTSAEKAWLKRNYSGEFHFLLRHGLKIFNEEDRAEGRNIARSLIDQDSPSRWDDSDEDMYSSSDGYY